MGYYTKHKLVEQIYHYYTLSYYYNNVFLVHQIIIQHFVVKQHHNKYHTVFSPKSVFTKTSQEREAAIVISIKKVNYKWPTRVNINRYITKAEESLPKGLAIGRVMDGVPRALGSSLSVIELWLRFIPITNSIDRLTTDMILNRLKIPWEYK